MIGRTLRVRICGYNMIMDWRANLKYDPIKPLLASEHTAIIYWAKRDLLDEAMPDAKNELRDLPIPRSILRKQQPDGSWTYPGRRAWNGVDYDQLETYRQLGFLVEMFGFTKEHKGLEQAAEYIFSKQTPDGDLRGIYANEYTPNYTAALVELLVKAGYADDKRIAKAFDWLLSYRVNDGGWALALRTLGRNLDAIYDKSQSELDRTKPYSHFVTGVVLRAFAAHDKYRHSPEAKQAARLLANRFFEKDVYTDKNHTYDWTRFSFPFWQTDILASLNSISLIDPNLSSEKILQAKLWLIEHQEPSGLFTGHLLKDRYHDLQLWYSLAICRVLKRMSDTSK